MGPSYLETERLTLAAINLFPLHTLRCVVVGLIKVPFSQVVAMKEEKDRLSSWGHRPDQQDQPWEDANDARVALYLIPRPSSHPFPSASPHSRARPSIKHREFFNPER